MEQAVAQNDVRLSDIDSRLNAVDLTSYDGVLLWKITEVSRRRQKAISGEVVSIQSPAFYTSRTGQWSATHKHISGGSMLGPGGTGPPKSCPGPPKFSG